MAKREDPQDIDANGTTDIIRRSRLFFTFPVVIISIVSANLIWEVVRSNVAPHELMSWPFRFTILNDSTTATVLAVFISLFMGRLQWARALRPIVGFAIDDEGMQFKLDSDTWRLWVYNSGPGVLLSRVSPIMCTLLVSRKIMRLLTGFRLVSSTSSLNRGGSSMGSTISCAGMAMGHPFLLLRVIRIACGWHGSQ